MQKSKSESTRSKAQADLAGLNNLLQQLERTENSELIPIAEWRRRREAAETQKREAEVLILRQERVPLSDVNRWISGMILRAAETLERIPGELSDRLVQMTNATDIAELLKTELDRARNHLAKFRLEPSGPKTRKQKKQTKHS